MSQVTADVHRGYRANHAREGLQCVLSALLLAAQRECEPDLLAQTAIGTRRSRSHAASQAKWAAQTTCSRAMQAWGLKSTGGGSTGDACHLVDLHRAGLAKGLPSK